MPWLLVTVRLIGRSGSVTAPAGPVTTSPESVLWTTICERVAAGKTGAPSLAKTCPPFCLTMALVTVSLSPTVTVAPMTVALSKR